jgi:GTPase
VTPVFCVSSVSGTGLDQLRRFFNLAPLTPHVAAGCEQLPLEFRVEEIYNVPDVGPVVFGMVITCVAGPLL